MDCIGYTCFIILGIVFVTEWSPKDLGAWWIELNLPEAKFQELQLKFTTQLNYGWFRLKCYAMFQDLSRRSIETGF